jgi:hypothetical protein
MAKICIVKNEPQELDFYTMAIGLRGDWAKS